MLKEIENGRHSVEVSGTKMEFLTFGKGRPLLFLHSGEGPDIPSDECLRCLGAHFRVIAPWHPGFGRNERSKNFRDVGDLAYLYLDFAEVLGLADATLVGASFGGWVAAEMAVRNANAFNALSLISPLGIKVRDRESRDIADIFAMTDAEFAEIAYADPKCAEYDLDALGDEDLAGYFRSRESLAFFGWKPYMHSPQLRRWLHRITVPTLFIAGSQDRVVWEGYHEAYSDAVRGSRLTRIANAGHFPHHERPGEVADIIAQFCGSDASAESAA